MNGVGQHPRTSASFRGLIGFSPGCPLGDSAPREWGHFAPNEDLAFATLLFSLADDEFVLGYWESEWTGIAPMLEEDVACTSMALDELGHATALFGILAELTGEKADDLAYGRPPEAFRHARLLDHARDDWARSVARRYLYDTADAVRLDALVATSYAPLSGLLAKIQREERYHLQHVDLWLRRLANGGDEARRRLSAALEALGPDAFDLFTPLDGEDALLATGVLPVPFAELRDRWFAAITPVLTELDLPAPVAVDGGLSGRSGDHLPDFTRLWEEMTMVYRSEPGAVW